MFEVVGFFGGYFGYEEEVFCGFGGEDVVFVYVPGVSVVGVDGGFHIFLCRFGMKVNMG